jgi:hypothetical protein
MLRKKAVSFAFWRDFPKRAEITVLSDYIIFLGKEFYLLTKLFRMMD